MKLLRLPVTRYALAVATSALILGLQTVAWPVLARAPFLLVTLAVVVISLFAGRGPGLLTVLLTGTGTHFLHLTPRYGVELDQPEGALIAVLFSLTGFAVAQLASSASSARTAAEESAARLAAVFASITDGFAGLDRDLRFSFVNGEAERLFGHGAESLLGADAAAVLGSAAIPSLAAALRSDATCTLRVEGAEGRRLEIRAHPSQQGLALYVTDRTEQERADWGARFLAEAGEILGSSLDFETTLQAVSSLTLPRFADSCVVDVLEQGQVRRIAAAHVDPVRQEQLRRLESFVPEGLESPILRVFAGETLLVPAIDDAWLDRAALTPEHRRLLDVTRPRSALLLPLRAQGRVLGVLTFCISDARRCYGPADVPLGEEIARRAALALDNARLFREANEAVRIREEFLSIASHELKTPLTSLRMQVQLFARAQLRAGAAGLSGREIGARIDTIQRQLDRLGRLIDRLLDVTRISAGRLHLEVEPADLAEVAREVADRFESHLDGTGPAIVLRTDGEVRGAWDRFRIEQVLTNLLDNALRFGGGEPVELHVEGDERRVRVHVADRGAGITVADRQRLFARFERLGERNHAGGLGLGLYISRQIVEAHGGTIAVRNGRERGTVFSVELPRHDPAAARPT
ncbi:ATP-binding protein [Vulgatibacter sp.]|uniref:sensor histidine kinase n=1 Tax=Vulgatibacter sp. TaxID=1971226 RepID=UPI00356A80DE